MYALGTLKPNLTRRLAAGATALAIGAGLAGVAADAARRRRDAEPGPVGQLPDLVLGPHDGLRRQPHLELRPRDLLRVGVARGNDRHPPRRPQLHDPFVGRFQRQRQKQQLLQRDAAGLQHRRPRLINPAGMVTQGRPRQQPRIRRIAAPKPSAGAPARTTRAMRQPAGRPPEKPVPLHRSNDAVTAAIRRRRARCPLSHVVGPAQLSGRRRRRPHRGGSEHGSGEALTPALDEVGSSRRKASRRPLRPDEAGVLGTDLRCSCESSNAGVSGARLRRRCIQAESGSRADGPVGGELSFVSVGRHFPCVARSVATLDHELPASENVTRTDADSVTCAGCRSAGAEDALRSPTIASPSNDPASSHRAGGASSTATTPRAIATPPPRRVLPCAGPYRSPRRGVPR